MKNLIIAILLLFGLTSCKKEAYHNDYERSYDALQSFKKATGNSYYYVANTVSWSGYRSETKISVRNGAIVSRDFKNYQYEPGDTVANVLLSAWHEGADSLGVHTDTGAALLTLDDVYTMAKNEWLKVDKSENDIYFEVENNGLISSCGYVPNGCMDDCFQGIHIKEITAMAAK
ncbi:MAG: hypothetical protein ABIN95_10505 [Mucilaginibacter sp.]